MSVCRICCTGGDTRNLYTIRNKKIIQAFEKITALKFRSVGRPTEICSFCCTWLLRCTTMSEMARQSEKIFKELFRKGLEASHADKLHLVNVQHLSVDPVKIFCLNDATTEGSCIRIIEEVSVKIERLEEPQETEFAVAANDAIIIQDEESNDLIQLEPNHSSAHSSETEPADQSANSIEPNEIYCCDICKKKFYSRQKFVPHVKTHEQSKIYCCDMCTMKFTTRKRIVAHIKRHNPKKLNICNLCGRKLSTKGNLSRHMNVHTGQKPFKCDKCNILFTQKSHLRRHISAIRHRTGKKYVRQKAFSTKSK